MGRGGQHLDAMVWRGLDALAQRPHAAGLLLIALVIGCVLPGVLSLPPVDRTEVFFATSARQLAEAGQWTGLEAVRAQKPVGAVWLQTLAARLGAATDRIATYRLPSLLLTALGVWLVYGLYGPVIGMQAAFVAAALVAVTPILVLQAHLAIAEPLVFPAVVAAQLSLLRLYTAQRGGSVRASVALFWAAQALSIPINAFSVPLVSAATLLALWAWDRRLDWIGRLHAPMGLAAVAVMTGLWLAATVGMYGTLPFHDQGWREMLSALAGSQQMNFRAYPGLFTAFLLLGFVPGHLVLVPAVLRLRAAGLTPVARFLLAWIGGYLLHLELLSDKPPLYVVQNLFPPAAGLIAIALVMARTPRDALRADPITAGVGALAGLVAAPAAIYALQRMTGTTLPPATWIVAAAVSAILALSAMAAGRSLLGAWLVLGVGGVALLNVLAFRLVLPNLDAFWASREIASAVGFLEHCPDGPIEVIGYREPSLPFVLGPRAIQTWPFEAAEASQTRGASLIIVERHWEQNLREEFARRSPHTLRRVACTAGINVARGCRLSFSVYASGPADRIAACRSRAPGHCPSTASSVGRACK